MSGVETICAHICEDTHSLTCMCTQSWEKGTRELRCGRFGGESGGGIQNFFRVFYPISKKKEKRKSVVKEQIEKLSSWLG